MRPAQSAFRFGERLSFLNKGKQSSAALFTSEAMLVYILVTQTRPDLYTFTSHSTTSDLPH